MKSILEPLPLYPLLIIPFFIAWFTAGPRWKRIPKAIAWSGVANFSYVLGALIFRLLGSTSERVLLF